MELAIVMIIIGLLIGGILKGQELIANAQITNAVTQIKGMDGAVATFRETYNAFPGDMTSATTRIAGCDTDTTCEDAVAANGGGNGRIDVQVGDSLATGTNEGFLFFNQMRVADLITGMTGTDDLNFGGGLPSASIGGGFTIGHTSAGTAVTLPQSLARAGHYLALVGSAEGLADTEGVLSASQAARIDRKLDNGAPNSGSVVGVNAGSGDDDCAVSTDVDSDYNEAQVQPLCNLLIRIQG